MHPQQGIQAGGTPVTLTGHQLTSGSAVTLRIGHLDHSVTCSSRTCVFLTRDVERRYVDRTLDVTLTFGRYNEELSSGLVFTFRPNPIVEKIHPQVTTVSGGTTLTVDGTFFDAVGEPKLEITMNHVARKERYVTVSSELFESDCVKLTSTQMTCPYPRLQIPPAFLQTASENVVDSEEPGKRTRGADFKLSIDGEHLEFYLGFHLDGYDMYENLTRSLPEQSALAIYALQPEFDYIGDVQYYAGMLLKLTGERLRHGMSSNEYRIVIGHGVCRVIALEDHELVCELPEITGRAYETTSPIVVSGKSHVKTVIVGNLQYSTAAPLDVSLTRLVLVVSIIIIMGVVFCVDTRTATRLSALRVAAQQGVTYLITRLSRREFGSKRLP